MLFVCSHANEEILPMPGFSSFGDDEVVHTESSDHHVSRQKLRKQLEKVTDDSLHQGQGIVHSIIIIWLI